MIRPLAVIRLSYHNKYSYNCHRQEEAEGFPSPSSPLSLLRLAAPPCAVLYDEANSISPVASILRIFLMASPLACVRNIHFIQDMSPFDSSECLVQGFDQSEGPATCTEYQFDTSQYQNTITTEVGGLSSRQALLKMFPYKNNFILIIFLNDENLISQK